MPYKEYTIEDLKMYWTISEIAKELGIQTSVIRHWEEKLPHTKPSKPYKNTECRRYSKKERNLIHEVYRLRYVKKHTLEGVHDILFTYQMPAQ